MNYYNPYFYSVVPAVQTQKIGIFGRLFGKSGVSLGNILNGTQRVLNFANQAIPLVKQVRPMIGNAKTMFKVMNEFKKSEKSINLSNDKENLNISDKTKEENIKIDNNKNNFSNTNGPTFFV